MSRRKKHSPAWQKARAERKRRRQGTPMQTRTEDGYIVKIIDGRIVNYDPGEKDRELWMKAREQGRRDSWEAPIA